MARCWPEVTQEAICPRAFGAPVEDISSKMKWRSCKLSADTIISLAFFGLLVFLVVWLQQRIAGGFAPAFRKRQRCVIPIEYNLLHIAVPRSISHDLH